MANKANSSRGQSNLLGQRRRVRILELLQEEGSARVSELSRVFAVSEPTIRQDLDRLQEDGLIIREYGGAFLKSIPDQVRSLSLQHTENMQRKSAIGRKVAEFVRDGDTIILDAGSTVTEAARNLEGKRDLTIVTNALNIALLLGGHFGFEVMVTGGEFKGPHAVSDRREGRRVLRQGSRGQAVPGRGRDLLRRGSHLPGVQRHPGEARDDRFGHGRCISWPTLRSSASPPLPPWAGWT